jgi:hypothetical protein
MEAFRGLDSTSLGKVPQLQRTNDQYTARKNRVQGSDEVRRRPRMLLKSAQDAQMSRDVAINNRRKDRCLGGVAVPARLPLFQEGGQTFAGIGCRAGLGGYV